MKIKKLIIKKASVIKVAQRTHIYPTFNSLDQRIRKVKEDEFLYIRSKNNKNKFSLFQQNQKEILKKVMVKQKRGTKF